MNSIGVPLSGIVINISKRDYYKKFESKNNLLTKPKYVKKNTTTNSSGFFAFRDLSAGTYLDNKSIRNNSTKQAQATAALYYHSILGQYVENDPSLSCDGTL